MGNSDRESNLHRDIVTRVDTIVQEARVEREEAREPNLHRYHHETKFAIGDRVNIDGCAGIVATVISIQIAPGSVLYHCAYVQDGHHREPWVHEFRISVADSQ